MISYLNQLSLQSCKRGVSMGKNKKEHFIFILMICTIMVFIMSCYNIAIMEGFSANVFKHAVMGFIPAFIFALIGDIFIVRKIVKAITSKFVVSMNAQMIFLVYSLLVICKKALCSL